MVNCSANFFILSLLIGSFSISVSAQYSYTRHITYALSTINYIKKPNKSDTFCINEVNRAERDILLGKAVFCVPGSMPYGPLRFRNELRGIVEEFGMVFLNDTFSLDPIAGRTEGCYCARMIQENFKDSGGKFRKEQFEKADSLYAKQVFDKGLTLDEWHCDVLPAPANTPNERITSYRYISQVADSNCNIGGYVDISFIIEKNASVSELRVNDDVTLNSQNELCLERVLSFVKIKIKEDRWQPGSLHGRTVRTKKRLRIHITNH